MPSSGNDGSAISLQIPGSQNSERGQRSGALLREEETQENMVETGVGWGGAGQDLYFILDSKIRKLKIIS